MRKDTLNKNFVKKCAESGAFPKRSSEKKIKRSAESFNFGVTWGVVQKSKTSYFRQNAFSVACRRIDNKKCGNFIFSNFYKNSIRNWPDFTSVVIESISFKIHM